MSTVPENRRGWQALERNGHGVIVDAAGQDVAYVYRMSVAGVALARARVMAAAPELLAALRDLVNSEDAEQANAMWDRAIVAIAKAEVP